MNRRFIGLAAAVLVVLAVGLWLWRGSDPNDNTAETMDGVVQGESGRRVLYWYDPMVPQERFDRPGKSPFMDMQLVPKYADEASDSGVRISPAVQQNLAIRIATATYAPFGDSVVTSGRIELNERELYALPSRVPGYVERLLVRAEGDPVSAGQKVAEIYSPDLLSAQQEFLALVRAKSLIEGRALVDAARERLLFYGMAEREIEEVARNSQARSRFGMYSPANGFVVELARREGAQIEAGTSLMSIADLSSVWLIADVPERDASRIRAGDAVTARLASARADTFSGTVDFVYPRLNDAARTTRVRSVVPNEDNELRPGMYANVTIGAAQREALSVPSEAIIHTGSRSLAIVKHDAGFRPVEVKTGGEHNGRTEVLAGLQEGEQVVASGQFLIDSEASLSGVLARLSQAPQRARQDEREGHEEDPEPEQRREPGESNQASDESLPQ
jgi:Cu(I)/Ag(I) efflux system membrane fusion protein